MSDKKRFFYVVLRADSRINTCSIINTEGLIFNQKEARENAAKNLRVDASQVFVMYWQEFENELDFKEFFK